MSFPLIIGLLGQYSTAEKTPFRKRERGRESILHIKLGTRALHKKQDSKIRSQIAGKPLTCRDSSKSKNVTSPFKNFAELAEILLNIITQFA